MTDAITHQPYRATPSPLLGSDIKTRPEAAPPAQAMDADTLTALVNALAVQMLAADNGKTGVEALVSLRAPALTVNEAAQQLTAIIGKLPVLLASLAGSSDPLKNEEGAQQRVAEAAVGSVQVRGAIDTPAAPAGAAATGADADIAARSANAGQWLKSSPFANLLALLRQLLLKFEAMDRKAGADMTIMQREMVVVAGERGVEKARESLAGAIGATLVTGAVSAMALRNSYKATDRQTTSTVQNVHRSHRSDVGVQDMRTGLKSTTTPTAELRPAMGVDGSSVGAATGAQRPSAAVQADVDADIRPMQHSTLDPVAKPEAEMLQAHNASSMAHAQRFAAQAAGLNMMATSVGSTVSAGVQIEAEMTEAERQLMLNVADNLRRIADGHQDQHMKTRDMREATAQLVDSLMNLAASTSGHIIGKY